MTNAASRKGKYATDPVYREQCIRGARKYYKNNTQKCLDANLMSKYSLTRDQYNELIERQAGLCAICTTAMKPGPTTCVDHDHLTNEVRGLLCVKCNTGIGKLGDRAADLAVALTYLRGVS